MGTLVHEVRLGHQDGRVTHGIDICRAGTEDQEYMMKSE